MLRANDVLSTSVRGVTRTSAEGYTVGSGGESTHTFLHSPIRDFQSLTVNSVAQYFLTNYTVNWTTGVLTWNTPLLSGAVVAPTYDYGSSDKIFPDFPRDDLSLTSFPRIGIELTSIITEPLGLGLTNYISDYLVTIKVYVAANKDSNIAGGFGGSTDLEATMKNIRSVIQANAKSLYTVPVIEPAGVGPFIPGPNNKLLGQTADFRVRFRVE